MGMAIDEAGRDPATVAVDPLRRVELRRVGCRAGKDDPPPGRGDDAVLPPAETSASRGHRRTAGVVPDPIGAHRHGATTPQPDDFIRSEDSRAGKEDVKMY